MNDLNLNEEQKRVLEMALEFYIRLGLGQFSEIATRLDLLQGERLHPEKREKIHELCEEMEEIVRDEKPWALNDKEISVYTLTAFLLESMMSGKIKDALWAKKRIKKKKKEIIP